MASKKTATPRHFKELREYLNALEASDQESFARRCNTTLGYLRKVLSTGSQLGIDLVIDIERHSGGRVPCETMLPKTDWKYLSKRRSESAASA